MWHCLDLALCAFLCLYRYCILARSYFSTAARDLCTVSSEALSAKTCKKSFDRVSGGNIRLKCRIPNCWPDELRGRVDCTTCKRYTCMYFVVLDFSWLPNLWRGRRIYFFKVKSVPICPKLVVKMRTGGNRLGENRLGGRRRTPPRKRKMPDRFEPSAKTPRRASVSNRKSSRSPSAEKKTQSKSHGSTTNISNSFTPLKTGPPTTKVKMTTL